MVILVTYVFQKLPNAKDDSQHAKGSQALLKSARYCFYHIFPALWEKCSCKMSFLLIFEILPLFVNILTADHKRSLCNRKNLCFISEIYIKFWTFPKKKMILTTYVFLKWKTAKDVVRWIFQKLWLRTSLDCQHAKSSQTLLKSAQQHFYHIFSSLWEIYS